MPKKEKLIEEPIGEPLEVTPYLACLDCDIKYEEGSEEYAESVCPRCGNHMR